MLGKRVVREGAQNLDPVVTNRWSVLSGAVDYGNERVEALYGPFLTQPAPAHLDVAGRVGMYQTVEAGLTNDQQTV